MNNLWRWIGIWMVFSLFFNFLVPDTGSFLADLFVNILLTYFPTLLVDNWFEERKQRKLREKIAAQAAKDAGGVIEA